MFVPCTGGRRLYVWRVPAEARELRGVVVHVPAFAEEMNKSRRMTAWAARELAARGFGVLQIDLLGCGDSSGDFGDASWESWVDDVVAAVQWARSRCGGPLWLWGLRAGALLAATALPRVGLGTPLLLWHPVLSGKLYLTQFLRLKLAAEMLADAAQRSGTKALREQLSSGQAVEVAGYRLSPGVASGLEGAEFSVANGYAGRIVWLEVGSAEPVSLSPAARARIDALRARGVRVDARALHGPGFWQSVEIEDCPELVDASLAAFQDDRELAGNPVLL